MQEDIHLNVFKEITRRRLYGSSYKRGFTLVEMIVVIVIIGIGASIAVPNFARMIQRNEWRSIVQSAQNAENALMALTGLQYANVGNPQRVDWPGTVTSPEKEFISINQNPLTISGFNVFQVTVARSGNPSQRSAGEQEFFKRTMISFSTQAAWAGGPPLCAVYCDTAGLSGTYYRYDLVYSEFYMVSGNRDLAVFHGVTVGSDGKPTGSDPGRWNIYQVDAGIYTPYGSL